MRIGFITIRPYKKLNNQFIGTQFFILGIPLFPIKSFFFVDHLSDRGIDIGLNWKHLLKIYSIILTIIFTILLLIPYVTYWNAGLRVGLVLFFILSTVLLLLRFDRMTEKDKEIRIFLGEIIGVNALPQYMNDLAKMLLRNKFVITLKAMLNTKENWKILVKNRSYSEAEVPLLFAIYTYESALNPTLENQNLRQYFL